MPSSNTITEYNVFAPNTIIRSARINTNFSVYRGHISPIDPNTATGADNTYDLGAVDNRWAHVHQGISVMTEQSTPSSNPTASQYKVYMKSDGYLYKLSSAGSETQVTSGLSNPMTNGGDIIYGGASGTPTRLANGSAGQVLTSAGSTSAPTWETPAAFAPMVARAYPTAANTATANNPFNFDTVEYDASSTITTGASWKFTAPSTKKYLITGRVYLGGANYNLNLYKNGTAYCSIGYHPTGQGGNFSFQIALTATDYIDIRTPDGTINFSGTGGLTLAQTSHIEIYSLT